MPARLPQNAVLKYQGRLLQTYQYEQTLYDGSMAVFDTVVRPDTGAVLPFLDNNTVLITRQSQPHHATPFWSLPGGRVDPDESHQEAAERELKEETGFIANNIEHWYTKSWSGLVSYEEFLFVGKDLRPSPDGTHLDPGERIELVHMPWPDLIRLCLTQQLRGSIISNLVLAMEFDPQTKARLQAFLE